MLAGLMAGCASLGSRGQTQNGDAWDIHDQVQHAAALVAVRYAAILKDLHEGQPDKALESADWWLDQTILLLATLEREHPERDWASRRIYGDDALQMRRVYKDIATKRQEYPRTHNIPFEPHELDMLNDFIERYK